MNDFNLWFAKWQVNSDAKERLRFYRKLHAIISRGVSLKDALEDLSMRYLRKKGHPFGLAANDWAMQIGAAKQFHDAIKSWVPDEEQMLIRSGVNNLELALLSVIQETKAKVKIKKTLKGHLWVIALYVVIILVIALGFSLFLIPSFYRVLPADVTFTGAAGIAIGLSSFIEKWVYFIGVVLAFLTWLMLYSLPRWVGSGRTFFDGFGPWALYRMMFGVSWLISLSALIKNGESLKGAIQILADNGNPWLRSRLNEILKNLNAAKDFGDALIDSPYNFPDQEILDDLAIYSGGSNFDTALKMVAEEWSNEVIEKLDQKMAVIKNFFLFLTVLTLSIFGGGMFVMIGQLSTIYKQGMMH